MIPMHSRHLLLEASKPGHGGATGAERAQSVTEPKIQEVVRKVGLISPPGVV
jgi:hypothetical protein